MNFTARRAKSFCREDKRFHHLSRSSLPEFIENNGFNLVVFVRSCLLLDPHQSPLILFGASRAFSQSSFIKKCMQTLFVRGLARTSCAWLLGILSYESCIDMSEEDSPSENSRHRTPRRLITGARARRTLHTVSGASASFKAATRGDAPDPAAEVIDLANETGLLPRAGSPALVVAPSLGSFVSASSLNPSVPTLALSSGVATASPGDSTALAPAAAAPPPAATTSSQPDLAPIAAEAAAPAAATGPPGTSPTPVARAGISSQGARQYDGMADAFNETELKYVKDILDREEGTSLQSSVTAGLKQLLQKLKDQLGALLTTETWLQQAEVNAFSLGNSITPTGMKQFAVGFKRDSMAEYFATGPNPQWCVGSGDRNKYKFAMQVPAKASFAEVKEAL